MTLIKKVDVTAYRAARRSGGLHLIKKTDDATKFVQPEGDQASEANPPTFVDDFSLDHSAAGGTVSAKVFPDPADKLQVAKAPGIQHS